MASFTDLSNGLLAGRRRLVAAARPVKYLMGIPDDGCKDKRAARISPRPKMASFSSSVSAPVLADDAPTQAFIKRHRHLQVLF